MKQYTITVNGVAYDVTVEEKNGGVVSAPKAVEKSAPAAAAPVASAPQAAAKEGNVAVSAPMPGKILAPGTGSHEDGKRYCSSTGWCCSKH